MEYLGISSIFSTPIMANSLPISILLSLLVCLLTFSSAQVTPGTYSVFYQNYPACSVATDSLGSIYVGLCNCASVLKFSSSFSPVASFNSQVVAALNATSGNHTGNHTDPIVIDSIAVTSSGLLWISDSANLQLLALRTTTYPSSVISTISLTTLLGGYDIAAAPNSSNVWVLLPGQSKQLWLFSPQGTVLAQVGASNVFASGFTVDQAGNLYLGGCSPRNAFVYLAPAEFEVVDTITSCTIVKVSSNGTYLQTFTPNTRSLPLYFKQVAVNTFGTVYAFDFDFDSLYEWNAAGVAATSVTLPAGGLSRFVAAPSGDLIAVSADRLSIGDLYANLSVRSSVATSNDNFEFEIAVALSPDFLTVYAISSIGGPIAAFDIAGNPIRNLGADIVQDPQNLCTDSDGNLYITDAGPDITAVIKMSPNGTFLGEFYDPNVPFEFAFANGLAIDPLNGNLVVADANNERLIIFFPNGTLYRSLKTTFTYGYSLPQDVVVTSTGTIIYTDNFYVTEIDSAGNFIRQFSVTFAWEPFALALSPDERIFVFDLYLQQLYVFALNGSLIQILATESQNLFITSLVFSPLQQLLYGADYHNNRIIDFPIMPLTSAVTTITGSLCAIRYSLPGNVDYPFSIATSLSFQYDPTPVTNSLGTAVLLMSGTGIRTFTNRFGTSFTRAINVAPAGTGGADNLIYLANSVPVDSGGLVLTLASPVQLPGHGASQLYNQLALFNESGYIGETVSSRLDFLGQAFWSSIPGFQNISIGASNTNSLSANYAQCQAPITFTNGLRTPTQPSASNGAVRFLYRYSISDGVTYRVQGNLTVTAASAFATLADQLGNPYQTVVNVTGTRLYTYLRNGVTIASSVNGLSTAAYANAEQRFYPYALLSSAPGVYSIDTAPFLDYDGIEFNFSPSAPTNGAAPGSGTQYNTTSIHFTTSLTGAVLTEGYYLTLPALGLQTQSYTFVP